MSTPSDAPGSNRPSEGREHPTTEERVEEYQRQLRRLASELALTEARQRRIIAGELHDHIGQALAFIRMHLVRLRGDAVFSGFEDSIAEVLKLVDQAINSTRSLTFQISPPVLYELGLGPALEWLGETLGAEHGVTVSVRADRAIDALADDTRVLLFQAVRELLVNAIKHAAPQGVEVTADVQEDDVVVVVSDDGCGFDVARADVVDADAMKFGLFSIRERLDYLGGSMAVESRPGSGTSITLRTPLSQPSLEEVP
jgi:signal transduction histidine kinase